MSGADIAKAVSIIVPIVAAFTKVAEESGASGEEKHAAVAASVEEVYKNLQSSGSVKEIKDVPWALVAPLVVPIGVGIISACVTLFNKLGVFIKKLFA